MSANDGCDGPARLRRSAIDTAAAVFEQLVAGMVDVDCGGGAARAGAPGSSAVAAPVLRGVADVPVRILDALLEVAAGLADLAGPDAGETEPATGTPVVVVVAPGGGAEVPVWVHNTGPAPLAGLRLRITRLTSGTGAEIPPERVRLHPPELDVDAGASACTSLLVMPPRATACGTYHGLVLTGAADAVLHVRVDVRDGQA